MNASSFSNARGRSGSAGVSSSGRQGFALLITITLLSFLVLLLVSLAALTRVETQVAANSQSLAQARQNALMALNIAIGQLQKYAGPDQRVTAAADLSSAGTTGGRLTSLTGSPTNTTSVNGTNNGLSRVVAGTRYWTGVWGNALPSAPTTGNGNIYEKTPDPVLLNWLVSGNETATFTPIATGQITAPGTGLTLTPSGAASPTTAVNFTLSAGAKATDSLKFSNTAPVVLLAGAATAGSETRTTGGGTEPPVDRYVVAPLVPINAPVGAVPGLGATAAPPIGHYAYWVGDEGVKARLNLADPNPSANTPATDPLARVRLRSASRSGAEVVADLNNAASLPDFSTTAYGTWSQGGASTPKALALSQLGMLDSATPATLTPTVLGRHFNDFTTYSVGVEADSYNGGLRKDLTYYLEQTSQPNTPLPTWTGIGGTVTGAGYGIIPSAYSPTDLSLSTSATIPDKLEPKWDILSSFYSLPATAGTTLTGSSSDTVNIQAATATKMGITPVVVQMRLLIGARVDTTNPGSRKFRILANPLVVLANPYNVKLAAPNGMDFRVKQDSRVPGSSALKIIGTNYLIYGGGSVFDNTVFRIPAFTLAPGKAMVFSYTGSASNVTNFSSSTPVPLSPGFNAASFSNVYREYANTAITTSPSQTLRLDETNANSSILIEFSLPNSTQLLQQIGCINPDRGADKSGGSMYPSFSTAQAENADYPLAVYALEYNAPGSPFPTFTGAASPQNGIANTMLRPLADFNPRGGYFRLLKGSFSSPPYTQFYIDTGARTANMPPGSFSSGLYNPSTGADQLWGRDWAAPLSGALVTQCILFDIPRRSQTAGSVTPTDIPVLSLAAFQHANLTAESIPTSANFASEFGSTSVFPPNAGHQPAYALGNSYASVFLPRQSTWDKPAVNTSSSPRVGDFWLVTSSSITTYTPDPTYFDISYLLNTAVWDSYFLSSIPQLSGTTSFTPINPRLTLRGDKTTTAALVRDGQQAAAYTLINGAFNVNSTSEDAWTAVLGGMKNLPAIPGLSSNSANTSTVFPRTLWQTTAAGSPPTGTGDDSYSGYRQLSDAQVKTLANAIVRQVRLRGPFVSLAQFVNRALISAAQDSTKGLGQAGALQKAIDSVSLNLPFSSLTTTADTASIPTNDDGAAYGGDANSRGTSLLFMDGAAAGVPTPLQRSTAIPGWLTQADILQAIGPVLSARSDTFIIRTYGDVMNPATGSTSPEGRAWCEAIVQRTPDYVDQTDSALTGNNDTKGNPLLNAVSPSLTNTTNQHFGRRFKVISFRWLGPNDI
jgi:Tfp pilus assembly protein PilX